MHLNGDNESARPTEHDAESDALPGWLNAEELGMQGALGRNMENMILNCGRCGAPVLVPDGELAGLRTVACCDCRTVERAVLTLEGVARVPAIRQMPTPTIRRQSPDGL